MSKKMGFWSVFALVTGSQIGSSVFMSPATLAPFGAFGLLGWLISGCGAMALSYVFASLCSLFPQTGGPHVYVKHAFGPSWAFFTGWTYWIISWVSTTAVIVTAIGYLEPFLPLHQTWVYLGLQLLLLASITLLNLKGVKIAGYAEFFLTLIKIIPLIILPAIALWYFNSANFMIDSTVENFSTAHILGQVTLLTLWGFIGLESATAPAESVENPSITIPRAILLGTFCVAILYIINSVSIMGIIPGNILMITKAPYVAVTQFLFQGNWHLLMAIVASLVCIGTLNAWILTSGQVSLGLANDKLMPDLFTQKNNYGAPLWGIIASSIGIVPLIFLTHRETLAHQMKDIIDISVVSFLFVYAICCLSFFKLLPNKNAAKLIIGSIALLFCLWVIYETPINTLILSSLFTLSGIPMYAFWYRKRPA